VPDERDDRVQGDEQQNERNRGGQPKPDEDEQGRKADAPKDRGVERRDGNDEDAEQQEDRAGQRSQEPRDTTLDEG